jgi:hypothetical protein
MRFKLSVPSTTELVAGCMCLAMHLFYILHVLCCSTKKTVKPSKQPCIAASMESFFVRLHHTFKLRCDREFKGGPSEIKYRTFPT